MLLEPCDVRGAAKSCCPACLVRLTRERRLWRQRIAVTHALRTRCRALPPDVHFTMVREVHEQLREMVPNWSRGSTSPNLVHARCQTCRNENFGHGSTIVCQQGRISSALQGFGRRCWSCPNSSVPSASSVSHVSCMVLESIGLLVIVVTNQYCCCFISWTGGSHPFRFDTERVASSSTSCHNGVGWVSGFVLTVGRG